MKRRARVNSAASPSQHRKYSGPRWRRIMSGTGPAAVLAAGSGRLARGLSPLVVFGPGYGVCAESYGPLLRAWASAGYVVAGIDFPLTSCDPINENDMVNQPADMAYVIRRLLAVSDRSSGFLGGLIDPGKIAVAGQSDGGDTVAALVANTCCRYRDVTATIVLAGAQYPPMGRSYSTHP